MPQSSLGGALIFEERMPLRWQPGSVPEGAALARLNAENHQLLAALATLEESRSSEALKDESPALAHELQRIEYKLNVLLRLTAQLAARTAPPPPAELVRLDATSLEWDGMRESVEKGAQGLLQLYISGALPEPLTLPAVVIGEFERQGTRVVQFGLRGISDAVIDMLEKLIFRHHRRQVAGSRLHPPTRS